MTSRAASATTVVSLVITTVALVVVALQLSGSRTTGLPSWVPTSTGGQDTLTVAAGTSAVAAGADGRSLYVGLFPAHGQGGVAVVDLPNRSVQRTVPLASGVLGVAVDRSGSRVYATASDINALEVIDPASGTVVRSIPVGSYPQGVVLSPDGSTAYVVDYGDDAVSIVDVAAGRVTATVPVGTGPGELAISPDGRQVVVGNQNDDSISVIDTAAPTNPGTVTVGEGAGNVAFSPDGTRLFVTLSNHGFGPFEMLELDPTSHETRSETQLDHLVFAIAAGADGVYAGTVTPRGGPAFLDTLTADGSATTGEDSFPGRPKSMTLSPDGRLLWAATDSSTVVVRRVA